MKRLTAFLAFSLLGSFVVGATEPWTLERALDYAQGHNPDARIAQQRIVAAQAGLEEANSTFWPKLQVQSSYLRTDNPMLVFGSILNQRAYNYNAPPNFNNLPNVDDLNARGIVTLPLYAGGQNAANRQAATANMEAAKLDGAAIRNALGFEVSRAFYTILKTRKFIQATESAVKAFENNLDVAQKRLADGTLLKSDVLDIAVRLAQSREDLVGARNAHLVALRSLRNLLGVEDDAFTVADTAPALSLPCVGDFSQRPELAAAGERAIAAQARVRGAKSGYQPRVSAFGSLDHDYGWVTGGDGNSYTAGLMVQWDLWDGFLTRAKTREAKANLASAREEQDKVRLAIDLEVEQARLDLNAAGENLAVSGKAMEQAEESARLTRNRFDQGLALPTQLIDSETALVAARVRRAEAEADEHIAIAALRKALALPQLVSPPTAK